MFNPFHSRKKFRKRMAGYFASGPSVTIGCEKKYILADSASTIGGWAWDAYRVAFFLVDEPSPADLEFLLNKEPRLRSSEEYRPGTLFCSGFMSHYGYKGAVQYFEDSVRGLYLSSKSERDDFFRGRPAGVEKLL